ncbi:MAG: hypothetical protein OEZ04_06865, partial [Nitrospinota bacterium]|nr:hypothetical protein [Nitrospinota bacterium]
MINPDKMTKSGKSREKPWTEEDIDHSFPIWFSAFSTIMLLNHGLSVSLRDGNAIMYRIMYDRGHSPEKAARLF